MGKWVCSAEWSMVERCEVQGTAWGESAGERAKGRGCVVQGGAWGEKAIRTGGKLEERVHSAGRVWGSVGLEECRMRGA